LIPCPVRSSITGKSLWGEVSLEEDLVDLARDCQLGFQLLDPALSGGEIEGFVGTQPGDLTAVDLVLLEPVVDGGIAHAEGGGELGDFGARSS
jgi:hypothetical protein